MHKAIEAYVVAHHEFEVLRWEADNGRASLAAVDAQRRVVMGLLDEVDALLGRELGPFIHTSIEITAGLVAAPDGMDVLGELVLAKQQDLLRYTNTLNAYQRLTIQAARHATPIAVRRAGERSPDWVPVGEFPWSEFVGKVVEVRWLAL